MCFGIHEIFFCFFTCPEKRLILSNCMCSILAGWQYQKLEYRGTNYSSTQLFSKVSVTLHITVQQLVAQGCKRNQCFPVMCGGQKSSLERWNSCEKQESWAFWQVLTGSQKIWKITSFKNYHQFTCFKCQLSLCLPIFLYVTQDMFTVRRNNPHMQCLDNPSNMENLFQSFKFSIQADTYSKKKDVPCLDYW